MDKSKMTGTGRRVIPAVRGLRRGRPPGPVRPLRLVAYAMPGLWVAAVLAWQRGPGADLYLAPLLAAAPVIACAGTGRRPCVLLGGACAVFALVPLGADAYATAGHRLGTCAAIVAVVAAGYFAAGRRARLTRELQRTQEIASAAQEALLRPLPPTVGGLSVASRHLSATRGAALGGDLYEVADTPFGVRVVIGDVRGHGLAAVSTVGAVLGGFREAAYDEPELAGVLRRLERGLVRHLKDRHAVADDPDHAAEEFVTLLLVEVRPDGSATALNCGHPWPYGVEAAGVRAAPVSEAEPLPPLGLFPLPEPLPGPVALPLPPGGTLFLFTDGAQDARDARGGFFPLAGALAAALARTPRPGAGDGGAADAPGCPGQLVETVRTELLRHAEGRLSDDAALLALRNDGPVRPVRPARQVREAVAGHAAAGGG